MKKFIVYYFFFLFFSLSLFCSGVIDSQDGFQYLAVARNIYYQHEFTAPPYEYTGGVWNGQNIHMSTQIGKDGKTYSQTGIGYSLAMIPAVTLSDLIYRFYNVSPPIHFPLDSDWFILLAASFTNAFFAALLGVIIFLYYLRLKINFKTALFLSIISIFTTNLFALAKHSYAHMMFTAFLLLAFYLLKEYSITRKKIFLIASAFSYGITSITYNQTFILAALPLGIYYLLLNKISSDLDNLKATFRDGLIYLIVLSPFILFYFWLENLRAVSVGNNVSNPAFFVDYAMYMAQPSQIPLLFEGVYGQLISPGRSIFIYSPILLLIIIFWYKIKHQVYPELIVFLLLSISYIILYAKQLSYETDIQKYIGYWTGELSWGPRYLLPLIPFGMLIVGHIYQQLKNKARIFIVSPLLIIGLFVEIIGITIPYQTKLHGLNTDIYVSGYHYTSFLYMNLLPQISPIFLTTKKFQNLIHSFPKTFNHGQYNVKFYDGIDFPFTVGGERWRSIDYKGYISFDNDLENPIKKISLKLINHPLKESSSSAKINVFLNQHPLDITSDILEMGKRSDIEIIIPNSLLKERNNQLIIGTYFTDPKIRNIENKDLNKQLIALLEFYINDKPVNLESLDFPYISSLGPAMNQTEYQTYGGTLNNPWYSWMIHTQIFERTPDFWWIKMLYYWDIPKTPIYLALLFNISALVLSTFLLLRIIRKK